MDSSEEMQKRILGKRIKDMSLEEALLAMSMVAARLREKTGNPQYKDVEDTALTLLDVKGKTGSDEAAIESAIAMLKKRGYKDPEEVKDGTHDI